MNDFFDFDADPNSVAEVVTPEPTKVIQPVETPPEIKPAVVEETFNFDDDIAVTTNVTPEEPEVTTVNILKELFEDSEFDFKEELPEVVTTETLKDVFSKYGEKQVTSFLEAAIVENPIMGNILSYVKDGGNPEKLIEHLAQKPLISKLPFETAEDKKALLMTAYTKFEDKSQDEAEILVKAIEDNGKLDSISDNLRTKLLNKEVKDIEDFAAKQKQVKADINNQRILYAETVNKILSTADAKDFKGVEIKDKPKLVEYLTNYKFKDQNNVEYTNFDVDLNKALKDDKKKILIAALLRTDFDLSSVALKAKEQLVNTVNPKVSVVSPVVTKQAKESIDDFYSFIEANSK